MTPYPDSTPFGCGRPGPERSVTHRLAADPPQALSLDQVWALFALRTSTPSRPGSSSVWSTGLATEAPKGGDRDAVPA